MYRYPSPVGGMRAANRNLNDRSNSWKKTKVGSHSYRGCGNLSPGQLADSLLWIRRALARWWDFRRPTSAHATSWGAMNFNRLVMHVAHRLNLWNFGFSLAHGLTRKRMLVAFMFHGVDDHTQKKGLLEYDAGMDKRLFTYSIQAITRHFNVVDIEEFLKLATGEQPLKRNTALLTFDDALQGMVEHAFPILEEYGCPSVIFAPTGCVGGRRLFWHLRVSNLFFRLDSSGLARLQAATADMPSVAGDIISFTSLKDEDARRESCRKAVEIMDSMSPQLVESIIGAWEGLLGNEYVLGIKCMSWEELEAVTHKRAAIESHAVWHRRLAPLSDEEINIELRDSRRELQRRLDRNVLTIAYPDGSFDDRVIRMTEAAGYRAAFTTKRGVCGVPIRGQDLFKIPRLGVYGRDEYEVNSCVGSVPIKYLLSKISRQGPNHWPGGD